MAIGKLFQHVADFFVCRDPFPWTDRHTIAGCEKEIIESNYDGIMKLSRALVHSSRPEDVQTGIAILEAALEGPNSTSLQEGEKLYLLALGNYRSGYDFESRNFVEQSLKISPDCCQAQSLQKVLQHRMTRDYAIIRGSIAIVIGVMAASMLQNRK